jgi:UPF0176 protein
LIESHLSGRGVLGTVLVASEGINVMLCGTPDQLDDIVAWFQSDGRFRDLFVKRTFCDAMVFHRLKVKVKREIVPLGLADVELDVAKSSANAVSPAQWRELLRRGDVVVIDNRNSFEFGHGRFRGAIDPEVENFREFASYFADHLAEWEGKTIAMYCTGGIRCDKTAAWASTLGVEVVTLDGGIVNFLQQIDDAAEFWDGTCFVFDDRRELTVNLAPVDMPRESAGVAAAQPEQASARYEP